MCRDPLAKNVLCKHEKWLFVLTSLETGDYDDKFHTSVHNLHFTMNEWMTVYPYSHNVTISDKETFLPNFTSNAEANA